MPEDLPTSIKNYFISRPSGSMKGLPTATIRERPDRNLTPSGRNRISLSCPARIVIRVPGRREPSGSSSCWVPANATLAPIKKIKNTVLAETIPFPKRSIFPHTPSEQISEPVFNAAFPSLVGWSALLESQCDQSQILL
jgi:hypothetical protein